MLGGGWPAFYVSLGHIGAMTIFVSDLARSNPNPNPNPHPNPSPNPNPNPNPNPTPKQAAPRDLHGGRQLRR